MRATRTIETLIDEDRGLIFDILIDLRHYDLWLPPSLVFRGTTSISDGPIRPGTTYLETSLWGARHGTILQAERPSRISYRQPMTLRPDWLGTIDIRIDDRLTPVGAATRLTRTLKLGFQGPVRLLRVAVARAFEVEIERMHARLKAYAEAMPRPSGDRHPRDVDPVHSASTVSSGRPQSGSIAGNNPQARCRFRG